MRASTLPRSTAPHHPLSRPKSGAALSLPPSIHRAALPCCLRRQQADPLDERAPPANHPPMPLPPFPSLLLSVALTADAGAELPSLAELRAGVVADANALAARRYPRPSHLAAPEPGTFGEALSPLLPDLIAANEAYKALPPATVELCTAAWSKAVGQRLPAPCLRLVLEGRGRVAPLLRATHRAEGGVPPEASPLNAPDVAMPRLLALQHGARLVALTVADLVAAGKGAAAWELCNDGFALGRDAAHGGALLGMMISTAIVGILTVPCAAALRQVPPAQRSAAAAGLERIRDGFAGFDAVMDFERIYSGLGTFGSLLTDKDVAALPPRAWALVRKSTEQVEPGPLAARAWAHNDVYFRALTVASKSTGAARAAQFADARGRLMAANLSDATRAGDFAEFAARAEMTRTRLDALAFLARALDQPIQAVRAMPRAAELKLVTAPDGGLQLSCPKSETEAMVFDLPTRP